MLRLIIILVLLPIAIDTIPHQLTRRPNYCARIESYIEETEIPKTKRIKVPYKTYCLSYFPCTKHRYEITTVYETIYLNKTKTVYDCCPRYEKKNNSCIPICRLGCGHGECVAPDTCLCDSGWRDPYCLNECEPNRFGKGCKGNCTCVNGGECDKKTGRCHCHEGYTGDNCELRCPINKYGQDCKYDCDCENDAVCDIIDGTCECAVGYEGERCEKPCKSGTHGKYCEKECICIPENTDNCHHVDGTCHCKPGYTGESCERECENFTYGLHCREKCNCKNSDFCDPIDGQCYCKDGWTGATCSDKCPFGSFGEDCRFVCTECLNISGFCDHVTGNCSCQYGRYGEFCEKDCLPGYWGPNCSRVCSCSNCDPLSGYCYWIVSEETKAEENKDEENEYDFSRRYISLYIMLAVFAAFVMVILLILGIQQVQQKLSTSSQTYWKYPIFVKMWRHKSKPEKSMNVSIASAISNPLYNQPDFVLESDQNEKNLVHGSALNGVKYFKNNVNEVDEEDKTSNTENSDVLQEENKNDVRDSDARKSHVYDILNTKLNELKRCSKRKSDSVHSSTAQLEEDFQPEELEDFNNFENIHGQSIYEVPAVLKTENMYDDVRKSEGKNT